MIFNGNVVCSICSWLFPFIGHMGITTSTGVIRDFSGSFYVAEDDMAFGSPTKYWQLDIRTVIGGSKAWDKAVNEASIEYFNRMVILKNVFNFVKIT